MRHPLAADHAARTRRRPRRAVTGRALVLGAVIIFVLTLLASPLSRWFSSRAAVNQAAAQLHRHEQQLRQVEHQLARWGDPGYIQRQARQRLEYAMPGDKIYVVVDDGGRNRIERTASTARASAPQGNWTTRLWHSVEQADAAG